MNIADPLAIILSILQTGVIYKSPCLLSGGWSLLFRDFQSSY
jgi:hypothetical protein